jgi:hypothetical protein
MRVMGSPRVGRGFNNLISIDVDGLRDGSSVGASEGRARVASGWITCRRGCRLLGAQD